MSLFLYLKFELDKKCEFVLVHLATPKNDRKVVQSSVFNKFDLVFLAKSI